MITDKFNGDDKIVILVIFQSKIKQLSSSGHGSGQCPRLFSKTGLNSCLKRTRAEPIIKTLRDS